MPITITERAAKEIKQVMEDQKFSPDSHYLKLGVKGGGCSGFSYCLDITGDLPENDLEFECEGIKIACDDKSLLYLKDVTIDFKDELTGRGFVFENPQSTGQCGCGSSFSV